MGQMRRGRLLREVSQALGGWVGYMHEAGLGRYS